MAVGPIPIGAVHAFADRRGMSDDECEDLEYVIHQMDEAYLSFVAEEQETKRRTRDNSPSKEPDPASPKRPSAAAHRRRIGGS